LNLDFGSDPNGTISVSNTFLDGLIVLPTSLPEQSNRTLTLQLGKLDLVVPFQDKMRQLNASAVAGGKSQSYQMSSRLTNLSHTDKGYSIEGITIQSAVTYTVHVPDEVRQLRAQQLGINSIELNNQTLDLALKVSLAQIRRPGSTAFRACF
jgi:hypothetical protein